MVKNINYEMAVVTDQTLKTFYFAVLRCFSRHRLRINVLLDYERKKSYSSINYKYIQCNDQSE
jgi:hypothetical protein